MSITKQIAKHFKEVYFGGNWTCSNFKEHLTGVTWQQATTQVQDLNTIATLTCHVHYYISAVLKVLKGGDLTAKDSLSFDHSFIQSQEDWDAFLERMWDEGEQFADAIAQVPDDKLETYFTDEKYGIYYRNLHGIIEHCHYHLGQIVLVKKMLNV